MSAKHTPGPWAYVDQEYGHDAVYGADGRLICNVFGDDAQAQEDARLIAAAPDLLAFIQDFVADYGNSEAFKQSAYIADAKALIAKATGEQQ